MSASEDLERRIGRLEEQMAEIIVRLRRLVEERGLGDKDTAEWLRRLGEDVTA